MLARVAQSSVWSWHGAGGSQIPHARGHATKWASTSQLCVAATASHEGNRSCGQVPFESPSDDLSVNAAGDGQGKSSASASAHCRGHAMRMIWSDEHRALARLTGVQSHASTLSSQGAWRPPCEPGAGAMAAGPSASSLFSSQPPHDLGQASAMRWASATERPSVQPPSSAMSSHSAKTSSHAGDSSMAAGVGPSAIPPPSRYISSESPQSPQHATGQAICVGGLAHHTEGASAATSHVTTFPSMLVKRNVSESTNLSSPGRGSGSHCSIREELAHTTSTAAKRLSRPTSSASRTSSASCSLQKQFASSRSCALPQNASCGT